MLIPSDYKDLLRILNKHKARYLIVGAYAVIYYTEPRYTKDIDIWVEPKIENAQRVYEALKEFGAPLKKMKVKDFTPLESPVFQHGVKYLEFTRGIKPRVNFLTEFTHPNLVYQMGVEPVRVDIIMGISGIKFEFAWQYRTKASLEDIKVNILGINELLKSKEKAKRPLDAVDIESLRCKLKLKRRI